jgi:hypothetical protein
LESVSSANPVSSLKKGNLAGLKRKLAVQKYFEWPFFIPE